MAFGEMTGSSAWEGARPGDMAEGDGQDEEDEEEQDDDDDDDNDHRSDGRSNSVNRGMHGCMDGSILQGINE